MHLRIKPTQEHLQQRWLGKTAQWNEWIFCLTAVKAALSSGVVENLRCVERCCLGARHARLWGTPSSVTTLSTHARRSAGIRITSSGLLQYQFVQCQDEIARQSPVFSASSSFRALNLIVLKTTILVAPAVVAYLRKPYLPHRIRERLARCHQHINLTELPNFLFSTMPFTSHSSTPPWLNPYFRSNHFKEGRSDKY